MEPKKTIGAKLMSGLTKGSGYITIIGGAFVAGSLLMKFTKMEEELNEHKAGLCGKSEALIAENLRLKQGLMGLKERVLDEVNRDDRRLPPLPNRLQHIFDSLH